MEITIKGKSVVSIVNKKWLRIMIGLLKGIKGAKGISLKNSLTGITID